MFLWHFGGFLDETLRMSDFVLGYMCMLKWMDKVVGNDMASIHTFRPR